MRGPAIGLLILACGIGAAGFLLGGPRGAVDWRDQRAVVLQSDDWGLAGFIPEADAWEGLDREALGTGRFPPVYWKSTLEDSAMVAGLAAVLGAVRDADGLPAVFQPNYVMGSLHWTGTVGGNVWTLYDLPELPPRYERPGLWSAVGRAMAAGVWQPEFHASYHYDPAVRRTTALADPLAREVTRRGIMLFPGSERARELGPARTEDELGRELDHSLRVFHDLFGMAVRSTMAPDYTWDAAIESQWERRGIRIIQGKREQIDPHGWPGMPGRLRKYALRRWDKSVHRNRVYLERNCRLEPVQAPDASAVVALCLTDTRRAWTRGQPAVVETHRINFVHTDPAVVRTGLSALRDYLSALVEDAANPPRFLTDRELASLIDKGTSWSIRGDFLVVRNGTRSRRVVVVPLSEFPGTRPGRVAGPESDEVWLVTVGPREVKKLDWRGALRGSSEIR